MILIFRDLRKWFSLLSLRKEKQISGKMLLRFELFSYILRLSEPEILMKIKNSLIFLLENIILKIDLF